MFNIFNFNNNSTQKSIRETSKLINLIRAINDLEEWARNLSPQDFPVCTEELKKEYENRKDLFPLIPKAFALTREAARRALGERMFDVQLLGGIILHQGRIAEMKTGEGKTLTSTTAAYLNTLSGNPVHIVTVNDYLAHRDAMWMQPVYEYLGLAVGYIISDMHKSMRKDMYSKNIIYATNNELGFDYLRDNLRTEKEATCTQGYHFCIIDEIDSVLIDEARTPLIISGPAIDNTQKYKLSNNVIPFLTECQKDPETQKYHEDEEKLDGDYKVDEKGKHVTFTQQGMNKVELLLNQKNIIKGSIDEMENFEFVHYVTQSLRAHKLFFKDVDYIVSEEGKVEIIDEFTGRILKGRRYSDGLHQAIEAKESIKIERQNRTLASVTFQNFFRMYKKLSGMTGTAVTEEKEFIKIYGLDVVEIPTNKPIIREDYEDLIYINETAKEKAIIHDVMETYHKGQPILLGTASIESSEKLSRILKSHNIPHKVLNAKNHENEAHIIAKAGTKHAVTIATNMAGRGTDIKLGGNLDFRIQSRFHEDLSEDEVMTIRKEEIDNWQQDYEEIQSLGGLYVLGTERHESRRIDNQLRGRSGRQGDPGTSKFFLSLDDQLLRLFGQGINRIRSLMTRTLNEDEPLSHSLISKTMERAQKNVEYRNFEIRKHLLNFDEVLNSQKNSIYTQREAILTSDNLLNRLTENFAEIITMEADGQPQEERDAYIRLYVSEKFNANVHLDEEYSFQKIIDVLTEDLKHKAHLVEHTMFNEIIRIEYLKLIDAKWQEHITQLDELRQAVHLRSYAQKNPLTEYKLESYELFDVMSRDISIGILRKFIGLKAENIHIKEREDTTQHIKTHHQEISLLSNARVSEANSTPQRTINKAPMHSTTKVGRNTSCPCGSGKKYKHCHGKVA